MLRRSFLTLFCYGHFMFHHFPMCFWPQPSFVFYVRSQTTWGVAGGDACRSGTHEGWTSCPGGGGWMGMNLEPQGWYRLIILILKQLRLRKRTQVGTALFLLDVGWWLKDVFASESCGTGMWSLKTCCARRPGHGLCLACEFDRHVELCPTGQWLIFYALDARMFSSFFLRIFVVFVFSIRPFTKALPKSFPPLPPTSPARAGPFYGSRGGRAQQQSVTSACFSSLRGSISMIAKRLELVWKSLLPKQRDGRPKQVLVPWFLFFFKENSVKEPRRYRHVLTITLESGKDCQAKNHAFQTRIKLTWGCA